MADHSDDLDELLDSALDDFNNLNVSSSTNRADWIVVAFWRAGIGGGLPDLRSKGKGKGKGKVGKENHAGEALEKLREQTREAVRGLETATATATAAASGGLEMDESIDEWVKQFQEMAGSQDMDSIVENMMQQLLSKEILQEPMKEIGEKYPEWLEEHKSGLSKEDYDRYNLQYNLIKELNSVYETDPNNFSKIVELMQKMQECGQPPSDIVQDLAPDLDLANLGQLSPEALESKPNCAVILSQTSRKALSHLRSSGLPGSRSENIPFNWKRNCITGAGIAYIETPCMSPALRAILRRNDDINAIVTPWLDARSFNLASNSSKCNTSIRL
ncbi:hypothetical protein Syun_018243 [Stephania yunnanensis]|uniref:Peroxin-19 n=1 Tax=Stephania yunnanensis TaxID=152371 RepID=A0AAP0NY68_9MAGN